MNKNNIAKLGMIFVVLISLSCFVTALGVGPTKKVVDFEAGMKKEISLRIVNNKHKDFKAVVYVRGELAEYMSVENSLITVGAEQEFVEFTYIVELPEKLGKPGIHETEIVVMEFKDEFASGKENVAVNAVAAVVSKLQVRVPYPGKYAESKVYVTGAMIGEDVMFTIPVFNFGKQEIINANAKVEIYGATYEKIGEFYTNNISLDVKGEGKIVGEWVADVNPGVYHAVVVVDYDGKKIRLEKNFEVGNLYVDIDKVNVDDFNLGDVAKFDIYIENMWNELLRGVYGEMVVFGKDGTEYTRFKTASIDLEGYETGVLEAYWSTKGIPVGAYDLDLTVFYEGKTTHKLIEANVNVDSITTESISGGVVGGKGGIGRDTVLMLVVFILLLINVGRFVYLRKRKI